MPIFSRKRTLLIRSLEKKFEARIERLQEKFRQYIVNYYLNDLTIEKNVIRLTIANLSAVNQLSIVERIFFDTATTPLLSWFARRLFDILLINRKYFNRNAGGSVDGIQESVETRVLQSYGVSKAGTTLTIQQGGWLHTLGDFKSPYLRVKEIAVQAVRQEVGIREFKQLLKEGISPTDKLGPIAHHFRTHSVDAFAEFNRLTAQEYSERLGLRAWLYNGGLIDTTREFCKKNNGKVFIQPEIENWITQVNQKNGPQWGFGLYNPTQHVGGHNCRHGLDAISDKVAIRLRPELASIWKIEQ